MPEYIERSAALDKLDEALVRSIESGGSHEASGLVTAKCQIAAVPAADVVEVVRCKDCKYFKMAGTTPICNFYKGLFTMVRPQTDYCSYGERSEG